MNYIIIITKNIQNPNILVVIQTMIMNYSLMILLFTIIKQIFHLMGHMAQ